MKNDEATEGDQLGLFGEGKRKARPKFKTAEKGRASQGMLLTGLDCEPGQTDFLGADGITNHDATSDN